MNKVNAIGSLSSGYRMREAIDSVRKTGAFAHVSDAALTGWFLGVAHLDMFGPHRHTRHTEARIEPATCPKCHGKKWYGHGRRPCQHCDGIGEVALFHRAQVGHDHSKITGSMHRSWRALVDDGLHDGRDAYLTRLVTDQYRVKTTAPDWVDRVVFPDCVPAVDASLARSVLMGAFTLRQHAPTVRLGAALFHRDDCRRRFDLSACLVRLALTFGCTCPVTGERVSRDDVRCSEGDEWLCSSIHPLGFGARAGRGEGRCVYVSPLSGTGKRAIRVARDKCRKALGKIDNDWILAEVMKTHMLRAAVASASAR